jgi:hypothetical protein
LAVNPVSVPVVIAATTRAFTADEVNDEDSNGGEEGREEAKTSPGIRWVDQIRTCRARGPRHR